MYLQCTFPPPPLCLSPQRETLVHGRVYLPSLSLPLCLSPCGKHWVHGRVYLPSLSLPLCLSPCGKHWVHGRVYLPSLPLPCANHPAGNTGYMAVCIYLPSPSPVLITLRETLGTWPRVSTFPPPPLCLSPCGKHCVHGCMYLPSLSLPCANHPAGNTGYMAACIYLPSPSPVLITLRETLGTWPRVSTFPLPPLC